MTKPIIGIGSDVSTVPGKRDRVFVYTTYTEALRAAGAIAVIIPPQPENAAEVVNGLDGLILAGGFDCDPTVYGEEPHHTVEPMDPRRHAVLARVARQHGIPTLGICLGMQVMNVAGGGTLIQDINSQLETDIVHESDPGARLRHDVIIENGSQLASIVGAGEKNVNSSHHQAVGRIAEGFRVTAHAPDGVVEALEDPRHPFYLGVQWHPEDMTGEASGAGIFGAFIEAAKRHAAAKRTKATDLSPLTATAAE
jgi:putative glutamine amidotransferase